MLNKEITNTVRECAEAVCPPLNEEEKKEPWEDECLLQMIRNMKKCKDRKRVKAYQKQIKDRRKYLKNAYFKELADNINTVAEARQVDKEFALAKKYSALKAGDITTISNHKLKEHFESHFASRPVELPEELEHPQKFPHLRDKSFAIKEDELTEAEVEKAISLCYVS